MFNGHKPKDICLLTTWLKAFYKELLLKELTTYFDFTMYVFLPHTSYSQKTLMVTMHYDLYGINKSQATTFVEQLSEI